MKAFSRILIASGVILIVVALAIFSLTFYPVLLEELRYQILGSQRGMQVNISSVKKPNTITPIDTTFGIVIPKIQANAKVIPNVNPYNEPQYQYALSKGVAQAAGSAFPGDAGNVFLFSHSSVNFYEALKYNSVFYLLSKLTTGDKIYLIYYKIPYVYSVIKTELVDPSAVSYLSKKSGEQTVTLMTCWPPGTTWKRLLVIGKLDK